MSFCAKTNPLFSYLSHFTLFVQQEGLKCNSSHSLLKDWHNTLFLILYSQIDSQCDCLLVVLSPQTSFPSWLFVNVVCDGSRDETHCIFTWINGSLSFLPLIVWWIPLLESKSDLLLIDMQVDWMSSSWRQTPNAETSVENESAEQDFESVLSFMPFQHDFCLSWLTFWDIILMPFLTCVLSFSSFDYFRLMYIWEVFSAPVATKKKTGNENERHKTTHKTQNDTNDTQMHIHWHFGALSFSLPNTTKRLRDRKEREENKITANGLSQELVQDSFLVGDRLSGQEMVEKQEEGMN